MGYNKRTKERRKIMTYEDVYRNCDTAEEAYTLAANDVRVAIFCGANPNSIKAIESALNKIAKEKGWSDNE